jgi:hypothetical protein
MWVSLLLSAFYFELVSSANSGKKSSAKKTLSTENSSKSETPSEKDIEALEGELKSLQDFIAKAKENADEYKKYTEAYDTLAKEKDFAEYKKLQCKILKLQNFVVQTDAITKEIDDLETSSSKTKASEKFADLFASPDSLIEVGEATLKIEVLTEILKEIKSSSVKFYKKPGFYVVVAGSIGCLLGLATMFMENLGIDRSISYLVTGISVASIGGGAVWMFVIQNAKLAYQYQLVKAEPVKTKSSPGAA